MAVRVVLESVQDFVIEELHHGWPGTRSVSSGHALPLAYADWADNLLRSGYRSEREDIMVAETLVDGTSQGIA